MYLAKSVSVRTPIRGYNDPILQPTWQLKFCSQHSLARATTGASLPGSGNRSIFGGRAIPVAVARPLGARQMSRGIVTTVATLPAQLHRARLRREKLARSGNADE